MRFISQQNLELDISDEWLKNAESVIFELSLISDTAKEFIKQFHPSASEVSEIQNDLKAEIKKVIEKNQSVWRDLKPILARHSHEKCWYCECTQNRSDMAVDHFRPKNEVKEEDTHSGYWWLAFDWKNFRLSCTYCNSKRNSDLTTGGKQTHFPLFTPPGRAVNPGDETGENIVLLDPCDIEDVGLLTYNLQGNPIPVESDIKSRDNERAIKSIELYHLHLPASCKNRKDIRIKIDLLVDNVNSFLRNGDRVQAKKNQELIYNMVRVDRSNEFTSAAKAYLKRHLPDNEWIKAIIENC